LVIADLHRREHRGRHRERRVAEGPLERHLR
jgi:hypothetical protein